MRVTGLNFNALRMQLETLIMNPGIQPSMVTVSDLFQFTCILDLSCLSSPTPLYILSTDR